MSIRDDDERSLERARQKIREKKERRLAQVVPSPERTRQKVLEKKERRLAEFAAASPGTALHQLPCWKLAYRSPAAARRALREFRSQGGAVRSIYCCRRCGDWHLTHHAEPPATPGAT